LPLAYSTCCLEVVKYLIENGASIEAIDSDEKSALHLASFSDAVDVVKYLVERGADLKTKDGLGCTALHLASVMGNAEVVQFLCENGANANATNNNEMTALHLAVQFGRVKTAVHLMKHNECNGTKLQCPCSQQIRLVKLNSDNTTVELNNGNCETKIGTSNNDVISALQSAVAYGHSTIVEDLIKLYFNQNTIEVP
jgi:ankyrin repeat protein